MLYQDLPADAQIAITVWKSPSIRESRDTPTSRKDGSHSHVLGGTTFALFSKNKAVRQGRYRLFLWRGQEADPSVYTKTPSKVPEKLDEVDRLERAFKKYERGDVPHLDWLDAMSMAVMEQRKAETVKASKNLYLYVETPKFDFPVLFHETPYTPILKPVENPTVCKIYDPEMLRDNPVEAKHRRLVRSHRSGPMDRDLKPNAKIRDELNALFRYPPTKQLNMEEMDLIWKFRFYLSRDPKAFTKFIKSVVWTDASEVKQTTEILLPMWVDITVDDALELLGKTFFNKRIRQYAVAQLEKADDEYLLLYLLQLVQAIKFEQVSEKGAYESSLVEFLTTRALKNPVLGNYFHWYLMIECEDKTFAKMYAKVAYHFMTRMVEIPSGHDRREMLRRQGELVERLCSLTKDLRNSKDARPKKIHFLREYIADSKNGLNQFSPLLLPLDPNVTVCGLVPEKSSVFKSQLMPLLLTFRCVDQSEYAVIFKLGDDLRQDQLIMQVITLMDKLLQKENMDLKLTPYKVLATGEDNGMLEFVYDSLPLATILSEYNGNLLLYLRERNANKESATDTFGIDPVVMDNYVKSCAGYCVITYLLGIGDRHLDNLLLTRQGKLFHVDFGFILGRDPKPFPPPMKLCREMVDAMGGMNSPHFQRFKSLCYTAFMILRKSSNLILNLFALMEDANVPDIRLEPDKAVWKVQEKFRLELSEEEAIQYFQSLINESVNALFPQLMETVHKWAQYWRK